MPHFMKKIHLISFVLIMLLIAACSSRGVDSAKPAFAFSHIIVKPFSGAKQDTVKFTFSAADNVYLMDTVNPYDTLLFSVALLGGSDILTNFSLTQDNAFSIELADTVSIKKYLVLPQSDLRQAKLAFRVGYTALTLPFGGVAESSGHSDFTFSLSSESPLSPGSITLRLPIR